MSHSRQKKSDVTKMKMADDEESQVLTYEEERLHGCAKEIQYVIKGSCWECVSHFVCRRPDSGYVSIQRGSRPLPLHRHIWQLENGRRLKANEIVKQACGNPACMNPEHLVMSVKLWYGYWRRKLNMKQADQIKKLYRGGTTQIALAIKYGVCQGTIYNIVHNKTYLEYPPQTETAA